MNGRVWAQPPPPAPVLMGGQNGPGPCHPEPPPPKKKNSDAFSGQTFGDLAQPGGGWSVSGLGTLAVWATRQQVSCGHPKAVPICPWRAFLKIHLCFPLPNLNRLCLDFIPQSVMASLEETQD